MESLYIPNSQRFAARVVCGAGCAVGLSSLEQGEGMARRVRRNL
jgi:hypothetical protein